jgi:Uma2 family endonuclease
MAALAESVGLERLSLAGLPMPATVRLATPMTDVELIAFSRRNRPYRIERNAKGELEIMSPVGFEGGQRELFAGARLLVWAEEHGGHCVSSNGGFTLPDGAVRSPDACWVSDARIAQLTEAQKKGFAPVCPEFLIEIISESDSRAAVEAKMEMWIANGAKLAWMIDPFAADLTIYQPGQAPRHVVRPDWVEAETVVPGFRLETSRLWAK